MYGTALSQRLVDISHNGEHLCNGKVREWRDVSGDLSGIGNRITHKLGGMVLQSREVGSFRLPLARFISPPLPVESFPPPLITNLSRGSNKHLSMELLMRDAQ